MRIVILDRCHPRWAGEQQDEKLRRLAGHLAARLREYNGFGIEEVSEDGDGVVKARIGSHSGEEAARLLAERGVFCRWEEDRAVFAVGSHTCFEELDWVQAAASELLE